MASRPSEPLLNLLRTVAQKKGLNTAALARATGIDRAHLKHVLAGSVPLTVDELVQIAEVLEINAGDVAGLPAAEAATDDDDSGKGLEAIRPRRGGAALATIDDSGPEMPTLDPYGNHAEQVLKLGFALGVDVYLVLSTSELGESSVPKAVLQKYPERLPLRLEAAFHIHHDPRFLVEGMAIKLSFDALYDCVLPWSAFQQITLFPLPPEPAPAPEPEEDPEEKPAVTRGHLRLVE
jgi:transcriptional regulator with XRE-family HTH domain